MKYKIGDRVRIVRDGDHKTMERRKSYLGRVMTIANVVDRYNMYIMDEDMGYFHWTDDMIEGLADEGAVEYNDADDAVNHPSHYTSGRIEVIDFIEDQKMPYHLGNVVKYIARAGKKNPSKTVEDLRKAEWYLSRYIDLIEHGGEMD